MNTAQSGSDISDKLVGSVDELNARFPPDKCFKGVAVTLDVPREGTRPGFKIYSRPWKVSGALLPTKTDVAYACVACDKIVVGEPIVREVVNAKDYHCTNCETYMGRVSTPSVQVNLDNPDVC